MNAIRSVLASIWQRILDEPVYTQALVVATIALGTAFGLGWNGAQVGAVSAVSAALLSWLTRSAVTPVQSPTLPMNTAVTVVTPEGEPNKVVTV
jgi:hypothetical protein